MAKKVFSPCFFSCVTCFVKNINALIQRHHLLQATGEREEKKQRDPRKLKGDGKGFCLSLFFFFLASSCFAKKKKHNRPLFSTPPFVAAQPPFVIYLTRGLKKKERNHSLERGATRAANQREIKKEKRDSISLSQRPPKRPFFLFFTSPRPSAPTATPPRPDRSTPAGSPAATKTPPELQKKRQRQQKSSKN